jgi:hypothetical protein
LWCDNPLPAVNLPCVRQIFSWSRLTLLLKSGFQPELISITISFQAQVRNTATASRTTGTRLTIFPQPILTAKQAQSALDRVKTKASVVK